MSWRHHAACLGTDPELYFPIGTGDPAQLQTAAAKAVCDGCTVTTDCLEWAMDTK